MKKNNDFCHLHIHDQYSFLDGLGKAENYAERAKALGFKYLALTNHGNIDGLITWQKELKKVGINPISGCELYIVPDARIKRKDEKPGHITALIKNEEGWRNICQILTYANLEGFYYKPRVDYAFLLKHCQGLVILTGCQATFLWDDKGPKLLADLVARLPGDVYLEVMPHRLEGTMRLNSNLQKWHKENNLPLVATNDCHYILRNDHKAQDVLLAIQVKAKLTDKDRFRFPIAGLHLRSTDEMRRAFKSQNVLSSKLIERAMDTTIEIAKKVGSFEIKKQEMSLPSIGVADETKYFFELCTQGPRSSVLASPQYSERFDEEYKLIKEKGFIRYFLIVWDLVDWCRKEEIMIGPNRGSVGGCLIAYLLGITSLDPIKFDLLFSRFITEDRIDYPDIDIDFQDNERVRVRRYLESKYGEDNVAGVGSFNRMKSRAVIRDVGRVFDIPLNEVDEFAKSVGSYEQGEEGGVKIDDAIKSTSVGQMFERKYPEAVVMAKKLEGQIRGTGQHAAGLVITEKSMFDLGRCNFAMRSDEVVVNWEKDDCEYMGLIKLDILASNTLTVLKGTQILIKQNHNIDIVFEDIELDDSAILKDISKGHTVGVFQIGTAAMTRLIKDMGIENFNLLSDAVALVRPGPHDSGMTDEFVRRKHGRPWEKKHRLYEQITAETYGIVVYQEQVMAVVNKVAGLPYATADKIRKIIGKKRKVSEFAPFKKAFIDGCEKLKTLSHIEAEDFWHAMEKHAKYSFNRSHSIGYALIGYWTSWCKHYYSTEFLCASLTYGTDSKDKKNKDKLVQEAVRLGLRLVPPRISASDNYQWVANDRLLYVPFIEIKGVGDARLEEIEAGKKRAKNGISSFFGRSLKTPASLTNATRDLLERVGAFSDSTGVTKRQATTMVGAFKSFNFPVPVEEASPTLFALADKPIPSAMVALASIGQYKIAKNLIKSATFELDMGLLKCERCGLREECKRPVLSSPGQINVAIVGDSPGRNEDREGESFIGDSGDLLWTSLKPFKLSRQLFHVTNVCKCWPRYQRKVQAANIVACSSYLAAELKAIDCRLVLALGNSAVKFFTGAEKGITEMCGSTDWIEEYGLWVCWCIHPAFLMRNPHQQKANYVAGIKNFVATLRKLR